MKPGGRRFRFGEFTFDVDSGEVTSASGKARLQPQPAQVLRVLLERPGELVTRDELKVAVWPDTNVESDQGLNYCVRQIRIALGEDGEDGKFVETLPRRGYRFLLPVEANGMDASPPGNAPQLSRSRRKTATLLVGALAVVAVWLVVQAVRVPRSVVTPAAVAVAVLPLTGSDTTLSARELQRDVTEQLTVALTNYIGFKFNVVGPATTSVYAADKRAHTEIGRELKVDYVISGGSRASDSTMFVQAIRVTDGVHVFAWRQKTSTRSSLDLARSIATSLQLKLTQMIGS